MKNPFLAISLAALFAVAPACSAEDAAAPAHRVVPTVTRTIQIFSNLENAWNDGVKNRDSESLKKILSDRYELRTSAVPGRPTPRDESIALAFKDPLFSSMIEQMAVHEYGDLMIVSFQWNLDVDKASPLASRIFVVDTWKRVDGDWQAQARYAAPADGTSKAIPGFDAQHPTINKKI
jgi:hypothetical protein